MKKSQISIRLSEETKEALNDYCFIERTNYQELVTLLLELAISKEITPEFLWDKRQNNKGLVTTSPLVEIEKRLLTIENRITKIEKVTIKV